MDTFTLFAANAIILLVMACAFLAARRQQRAARYWISWTAANVAIAASLLLYMVLPAGRADAINALPNCLLVVGIGLRLRAARQFMNAQTPWLTILGPAALVFAIFLLPDVFGYGTAFGIVNVVLTALSFAVAREFWRARAEGLSSRFGLIACYGLMGVSFALRGVQGLVFGDDMASYLPRDIVLEMHLLIAVILTAGSGAFALSIAYERSAAELRRMALRDPLTGLHNRRAFEAAMREVLAAATGRSLAVVLFDVDHFKRINDLHGHAAGDAALRLCADLLARSVRGSDFVARIGGEEFAVILPDTSAEEAFAVTERARRMVEDCEIEFGEARFKLTLSAGLCHGVAGAHDFDALMRKADASLYQAKESGRNRIEQAAA